MKTRALIYVKKASLISKAFLSGMALYRPTAVNVLVDSEKAEPITVTSKDGAFELDLEPGQHILYFTDPTQENKRFGRKVIGFFFGMFGGLASGLRSGVIAGGNTVRKGSLTFHLNEGDIIKVVCSTTMFGGVKVEVIN